MDLAEHGSWKMEWLPAAQAVSCFCAVICSIHPGPGPGPGGQLSAEHCKVTGPSHYLCFSDSASGSHAGLGCAAGGGHSCF